MKYFLSSNERGYKLEEEIHSLKISDVCEFICDSFQNDINDSYYDAVHSNPLMGKAQGFFPEPNKIGSKLLSQMKQNLKQRISNKQIFGKAVDNKGDIVENISFDVISLITDNQEDNYRLIIETGSLIILMLTNFLTEGVWNYGLKRNDGTILTVISQWPKPEPRTIKGNVIWQDSNGRLDPIIWFGLKGEEPIECWTLNKSPKRSELQEVYNNPYASKTNLIENWHRFWFNASWDLNWNALFNNDDKAYIIWMFAECGMEEPTEQFNMVRDSCPIELCKNDTAQTIAQKIDQFFIDTQMLLNKSR